MTVGHTLEHPPSLQHPAFLVIQTDEVVDSRDNPVLIVKAPSGGADWVLIGHLTRGAKTHIVEIGTSGGARTECSDQHPNPRGFGSRTEIRAWTW
jgi:hypothetical protein